MMQMESSTFESPLSMRRRCARASVLVTSSRDQLPLLQHTRLSDASSGVVTSNTVGPDHVNRGPLCKRFSLDSSVNSHHTDYGLLITLHKNPIDGTTQCQLSFTPDEHYTEIHPNAYAPANLGKMHKLGGGGSGVAVFEGHHPQLGDIVMKHGGDKDLKELFALATIAEELKERGRDHPQAAQDLQSKIPEFRMIYISPHHLGEKRRELWYRLSNMYKYSSRNLLVLPEQEEANDTLLQQDQDQFRSSLNGSLPRLQEEDDETFEKATPLKTRRQKARIPNMPSRNGLSMTESGTISGHRDIAIFTGDENSPCSVELLGDSLTCNIPWEHDQNMPDGLHAPIIIPGDGYVALKAIAADLNQLMKEHKWKFTLGQKRIGGKNPQTGNQWLYAGQLEGQLLDNLIAQNIQLVKDLVTLTTPQEQSPQHLREVQEEVVRFEEEEDIEPGDISAIADSFVGNAIKKNFKEGSGRFPVLIALGRQFRGYTQQHPKLSRLNRDCSFRSSDSSECSSGYGNYVDEDSLVLLPEEEVPGFHLGNLLRSGAIMGDSFEKVPMEPTVLEMQRHYWRTVLRAAILPRRSGAPDHQSKSLAMTRLWTCGLADAGVHNLFLAEDFMWLFDLGQPELASSPGFLTKFLFSFFHTMGMEETEDGGWVRRFEHNPVTNKLVMTRETETLLAKAYDAFDITLDRLIQELFDGDDSLRWLLIQYVTLQLISDASFCLQRWTIKGGGRARDANHQTGIEKWLWRAIWDMYVAFDINTNDTWTRLFVEHPSHRDSTFFTDMRDLIKDAEIMAALERIDEMESKEEENVAS